jgi:hypothetical protein
VAVNNEPIGPSSSVAEDADPLRLTAAYVMTFIGQNAAYVLHTGAGIRGGGERDLAQGRQANLFDVQDLDEALGGMRSARAYLPPDLPNWTRVGDEEELPLTGLRGDAARRALYRTYAVRSGERFVVVVLGLRRLVQIGVRADTDLRVIDPAGGKVLRRVAAHPGEVIALEPRGRGRWGDGFVILGG